MITAAARQRWPKNRPVSIDASDMSCATPWTPIWAVHCLASVKKHNTDCRMCIVLRATTVNQGIQFSTKLCCCFLGIFWMFHRCIGFPYKDKANSKTWSHLRIEMGKGAAQLSIACSFITNISGKIQPCRTSRRHHKTSFWHIFANRFARLEGEFSLELRSTSNVPPFTDHLPAFVSFVNCPNVQSPLLMVVRRHCICCHPSVQTPPARWSLRTLACSAARVFQCLRSEIGTIHNIQHESWILGLLPCSCWICRSGFNII